MADRIPVTGLIGPIYEADTYAITDAKWALDGLRNVSDITERNNIPEQRRRAGMIVGVDNGSIYYKLKASPWTYTDTDWEVFTTGGGGGGSASSSIRTTINTEVTVDTNTQYLIYGDLSIVTGGSMTNNGEVVILNGSLTFSGSGTYSGVAPMIVNLPRKYTATFSLSPNTGLSFSHNLNTQDVTISVRDGLNFIYPNLILETTNPNNVVYLYTTGTVSNGSINIIG